MEYNYRITGLIDIVELDKSRLNKISFIIPFHLYTYIEIKWCYKIKIELQNYKFDY